MGVSRGLIKLLMREGRRKPFSGRILTLGKQDIYASAQSLPKWADEMRCPLNLDAAMEVNRKDGWKQKRFVKDTSLFSALGFDRIDSLDYSDFEGSTIVHDLNQEVPGELYGLFDFILDAGTLEHVFDTAQALSNCYKMLKVGGRIVHYLPSNNCVEHGFFMFSPTFFNDYYGANQWDIACQYFIEHNLKLRGEFWKVYEYVPERLAKLRIGHLDGIWYSYVAAEKTRQSTFNAPVNQGAYRRMWSSSDRIADSKVPGSAEQLKRIVASYLPEHIKQVIAGILRAPAPFKLKLVAIL